MPTKIEWTDETWTPIRARNRETGKVGHFCIHVSPGCAHCYAERLQPRFGNPIRYAAQDAAKVDIYLDEKTLTQPQRWRRPRMVFVCSMTDLFLQLHPADMIGAVLTRIAMSPHHSFQVLTKRSERAYNCITRAFGATPPPNLWLGVSVEDRARKGRIDNLRETPAAVRFLSLEPLLEDLGELDLTGIGWVIVGGESGPNARPMERQWAGNIRDQCIAAGVPFFFKQWGEWAPVSAAINEPSGWDGMNMHRVGKKRAGRQLDGRSWDEMPPTIGG